MVTLTGGSGNDILTGSNVSDVLTGNAGNDSLYGGASADSLYGGDGNDLLQGGSGADRLEGGAGIDTADYISAAAAITVSLATGTGTAGDAAGDVLVAIENIEGSNFNDSLTGSTGANLLSGGAGNDTLAGGGGLDTLDGDAGIDTVTFAASTAAVTVNLETGVNTGGYAAGVIISGVENIIGSGLNDNLTGDTGANALFGGAGTDILTGGGGADTLDGGTGTDTANYATSGSGVSLNQTTGVYSGGDAAGDSLVGIENLTGSNFDDSLTGGATANVLTANDGDDLLSGLAGADSLFGGAGNDTLMGGTGSDSLNGGAGVDLADYSASTARVIVNLATGVHSGGDAAGDVLTGIEDLAGSALNDILTGNTGNNYLWGGLGADQLNGGDGNDTLAGGAGIDTINGGAGMDFADYSASATAVSVNLNTWVALYGDAQGDVISGTDGIIGTAFDDTLIGFNDQGLVGDVYTNVFFGGGGNDYIDGLGSNDNLYGGSDNDTVAGGAGDDSVYGGDGNDSLLGGDGADLADGGDGTDSIYGGAGNDSMYGGGGNDLLSGGAGNDLLAGGDGNDTLFGGAGDTIDGSGTGVDVLDLTGSGAPFRIIRDPLNPTSGIIEYLNNLGAVIGTLTFNNIETIVMCFTPGTRIATHNGSRAIENLKAGDLVMTRDHGLQPIRWIGQRQITHRELAADPALQPILIKQAALGQGLPECDMMVSRQHRMLVSGAKAELMFGVNELLVRAQHLTCLDGVEAVTRQQVTYLHMLFDRHELVLANGAWSESFQPGERSLGSLADDERSEMFKIFPELAGKNIPQHFDSARVTLKSYEARALLLA